MNQDIFRSAVHRSLSKSLKSKEKQQDPDHESAQFGSINPQKNYKTPFSLSLEALTHETSKEKREKEEREKEKVKAMAMRERTELKILKAYKGATNKKSSKNLDEFSKDFAESLLKGAIDLQESLNMLETFQANVNKKKRKPQKGEEIQEVSIEGYNSNKLISYGSSSNNFEGLGKVIKESLYKQNLIMDMESLDDVSSLSSRSFKGINYYSNNYNNINNNNNSRGLVAKLMGLGEVPMDLENYQKGRNDTNMKSLSSPRAFFDLDKMPSVRKETLFKEKIDPNRKALDEIMETMQFKGLMHYNQSAKEEFDAILVKDVDRSAKLVSKERKTESGNMIRKREERKEVKSNETKSKIEPSKNVKSNYVRNPDLSVKRKIEEKKGVNANASASKAVQKSERKTVSMSNGVANRVASNSNVSVKEKSNNMVINKPRSSNVNVADKRIKREEREMTPKKQKINGVKTNSRILRNESNTKKKKTEIVPSVEDDLRDDWSVSFEASPQSTTSHSFKEEQEENQFINNNFSPKKEINMNVRLLLLGDKSFIKLTNELTRGKIEDLKLCLDIAEEQISRKKSNFELFYPPYQIQGIKPFYSVGKSIGDLTSGIRKLNGYTNLGRNNALKDRLYLKLEKDLNCKNEGINSIWDLGWNDWICVKEASYVVCDFSDFILSLLIEEVSLDLFV